MCVSVTSSPQGFSSQNGRQLFELIRQREHTRSHLWHRYSVTVDQVIVATVKRWSNDFNLTNRKSSLSWINQRKTIYPFIVFYSKLSWIYRILGYLEDTSPAHFTLTTQRSIWDLLLKKNFNIHKFKILRIIDMILKSTYIGLDTISFHRIKN